MTDRYLKGVLTVIALELLWLGVKDVGTPVKAQANREPTPVVIAGVDTNVPIVIRGIEIRNRMPNALPIYGAAGGDAVAIEAPRPIPIVGSVPLRISVDKPLPVTNVGYTPGNRPGE